VSRTGNSALPPLARLIVGTVTVIGVAVVVRSAAVLVSSDLPLEWTLFAFLTIASGMLSLKLPSIDSTRFSISEAFAFASVLLFGPAVGVLTLALDGVRISFRWKMNATQTAFNFANLGLSMWAAGTLFFSATGMQPLYMAAPRASMLLAGLGLMTVAYFGINSGLIAAVVGLSSRRSIPAVWREHYLQLLPNYVAGAAVAMLVALAFREVQFTAIALSLPFILICYLTLRSSFGRLEDAKRHVEDVNRLLLSTVETLATAIDAKDEVTHDHVRRVQQGTLALARAMGVSDDGTLQAIEAAALLHDTGKIAVPEHILNKPGKLTPAEFEKMKRHAPIGADILSSIAFPYPVVPIVRHHHENWDGTGYPDRLAGEAIPLGARILSVVDCFDALTSDRPYRRRMTDAQALAIIEERRGKMYDPAVVDAFMAGYKEIMPAYNATLHPATRAIEDARALDRATVTLEAATAGDSGVGDGLLAITSLSRALSGDAGISDIGALLWPVLKQILPCDAMAILVPDVRSDQVVARYAVGHHASRLRGIRRASGTGIAGWVAVTQKPALNADPAIDCGYFAEDGVPALRSCLAVPLGDPGALVAVLTLYRTAPEGFSDDHARLVELLGARLSQALAAAAASEAAGTPAGPLTLVRGASCV
jgi:putative nucleotidyltransferase with HDIG domain